MFLFGVSLKDLILLNLYSPNLFLREVSWMKTNRVSGVVEIDYGTVEALQTRYPVVLLLLFLLLFVQHSRYLTLHNAQELSIGRIKLYQIANSFQQPKFQHKLFYGH